MFKYGTFSRLFGNKPKAAAAAAAATDDSSDQSPPTTAQQQPDPATSSSSSSTDASRKKCLRVSLIVMFSSGVVLAVGLLAGLLTRHADAANPGNSTNRTTGPQHNIVFIMTDDQDKRLFSTDFQTVLQREMVAKGTNFTNHYTTQALCCPARSSLLRGQQIREWLRARALGSHQARTWGGGGPDRAVS